MIKTELFIIRSDGVKLYRTYSDENKYILQVDTGNTYSEAVDIEGSGHTYEETQEEIEYGPNYDETRESR